MLEAAAVPVDSFFIDVKDPTDAEITSFFDKYKDREALPEYYGTTELPSPTPGFKIPRKIDLQFVQAKYDEFLTKAEAKVTDAEIAKYYDEHKSQFVKADTGLMEENGPKKDTSKPNEPAIKSGVKEGTSPVKPLENEPKSDEKEAGKAAKPTPPATKPSAPPAAEKESGPAPGTDSATHSQQPEEKKAPSANEKKSSYQANPSKNIFRLAAFEKKTDEKAEAKSDTSVGNATSGSAGPESKTAEPAEKPAAASPPTASSKETSAPAAPKPPTSPAAAPTTPAPTANPEAPKTEPSSTTAPPAAKKPEYQPLSEVKDEIRRTLAEANVEEQLKKLTEDIQIKLDSALSHYNDELAGVTDNQQPPAPPKSLTDLESIAQKNGLKYGRTGPKSVLELREMPVGKTYALDSGQSLLAELFTTRELDKYQPVRTVDVASKDLFVVMKMSDTPARVPELSEVRAEVVRAWKKEKAAQLAQKHAEELAKKAQDSKQPLMKFFADNKEVKVVRTDPFSELTGGEVSPVTGQIQPLRISQPDGIVAAGPEFLKRVFELKEGDVAVVMNHNDSIAYIVRIVEHETPLPELHTAYLAEANNWLGEYAMIKMHRSEVAASLEQNVMARANLHWDRTPDKKAQDESDEG